MFAVMTLRLSKYSAFPTNVQLAGRIVYHKMPSGQSSNGFHTARVVFRSRHEKIPALSQADNGALKGRTVPPPMKPAFF